MKNVFVLGLEPFNLELLQTIRGEDENRFHELFGYREIVRPAASRYPPLDGLVDEAVAQLDRFQGRVDAVMGYWDFPTSGLVPMIAQRMGLPGPSLESVARCEHKYWSRIEQEKVVPECVPAFQSIDPFAPEPLASLELDYPFWIKPVKAHSSFLGFYVDGPATFQKCLAEIRDGIGFMGESFNQFLAHVELPASIEPVGGYHCIAEELLSTGHQCTLEGYAWRGEVEIYGVVDSLRSDEHPSCFTRYQYPSTLPDGVQARMAEVARKLVGQMGYDNGAFNVEFYWDDEADRLRLLEINTRISRSHSPQFLMVDGASNQKVPLDLALGQCPAFPHRAGAYRVAAKFMLRYYEDGVLERVPTEDDIRELRNAYPDARVRLLAPQGTRLSLLPFQDSYSYEVAEIFLGADTEAALLDRYREARELLDFRVRPVGDAV